jgi:hypothetical protein
MMIAWREGSMNKKLALGMVVFATTKEVGRGPFVIGDTLVRPRVPGMTSTNAVFRRSEKLNVWMQVYNLAID